MPLDVLYCGRLMQNLGGGDMRIGVVWELVDSIYGRVAMGRVEWKWVVSLVW